MPTPKPKRLGDPNRTEVRGFRGATAESLRAARLEGKAPAGQSERRVSYDPEAVRAAIEAQLCPFCGRGPYKVIAVHTNKTHGIDKWELREMAGLTTRDSICAPEYASRARELAVQRKIHEFGAKTSKNGRRPQRWTTAGLKKQTAIIAAVNERTVPEQRIAASRKAAEARMSSPTCKHGHEWTPENTRTNKDGSRTCRACEKDRGRRKAGFTGTHEVIDAIGTVRRLQALAAIGYPVHETVARVGLSPWWAGNIMKHGRSGGGVSRATADAVAALYEELRDVPAPDCKGSKITRTMAAKKGWAPPSAWSTASLDDPNAVAEWAQADKEVTT
ncbi:hypothetical protein [Streptomyces albogriseolus]|uniref:hypothetical protein n=1 Tax=Streptomyces albogriseolus TaxID=1887 RepID=UPI00368694D0